MKEACCPGRWLVLGAFLVLTNGEIPDAGSSTLLNPCIAALCANGTVCAYPECSPLPCTSQIQCLDPADDMCAKYPRLCHNNGRCYSTGRNSYECECSVGRRGTNCHLMEPEPCDPNPCENGATCVLVAGSAECQCSANFLGPRCEKSLSLSSLHVCSNTQCGVGEICVPVIDNCSTGNCPVLPMCTRMRPGICPFRDVASEIRSLIAEQGTCQFSCLLDAGCPGNQKCCQVEGCSSACVQPNDPEATFCQQRKAEFESQRQMLASLSTLTDITYRQVLETLGDNPITQVIQRAVAGNQVLADYYNMTLAAITKMITSAMPLPLVTCTTLGAFNPVQCTYFMNKTRGECSCVDLITGNPRNKVPSPDSPCNEVNECDEIECQNGGSCFSNQGQFYCACPDRFSGEYCELDITGGEDGCDDECVQGRCVADPAVGPICTCNPGWTGRTCDRRQGPIDICAQYPDFCQHGRCQMDPVNGFRCVCDSGYIGVKCERQVVKPGLCPAVDVGALITGQDCIQSCNSDSHCSGPQRCCMDGCNARCMEPLDLDAAPCRQQQTIQTQALALISGLAANSTPMAVRTPIFATGNNTHLVQLLASVSGTWDLELFYTQLGNLTFSMLKSSLSKFSIPRVNCTATGRFVEYQCQGNSQQTTYCYCVLQTGIRTIDSFFTGSNASLSCNTDRLEVRGRLYGIALPWIADYKKPGTAAYRDLMAEIKNWARRAFVNSTMWRYFSEVDVLGFLQVEGDQTEVELSLRFASVYSLELNPTGRSRASLSPVTAEQLRTVWLRTPFRATPMSYQLSLSVYDDPADPCKNLCSDTDQCIFQQVQCFTVPCYPVVTCVPRESSFCDGPVCLNGGTCSANPSEPTNFICSCPTGFSGGQCQVIDTVPTCETLGCLNGGGCSSGPLGGAQCVCPRGYTGELCQQEPADLCAFESCGEGYVCSEDRSCSDSGQCTRFARCYPRVTGECPAVNIGDLVLAITAGGYSCKSQCSANSDCDGDEICCPSGPCQKVCVRPLVGLTECERQRNTYATFHEGMARLSRNTEFTYGDFVRAVTKFSPGDFLFGFDDFVASFLMNETLASVTKRLYDSNNLPPMTECSDDGEFSPFQCLIDIDGERTTCYCVDPVYGFRKGPNVPFDSSITCSEDKLGACPVVEVNTEAECSDGPTCEADSDCRDEAKCCLSPCGAKRCQTPISPCDALSCENGGSCTADPERFGYYYYCSCPDGYTGEKCETPLPSVCDDNPCLEGGSCEVFKGRASCICVSPFHGRYCEKSIRQTDLCRTDAPGCAGGAICLVEQTCADANNCSLTTTCSSQEKRCSAEKAARFCLETEECYDDAIINHRCICMAGFSGDNCAQDPKPGFCPSVNLTAVIYQQLTNPTCSESCVYDAQCPGDQKCCPYSQPCGGQCVQPVSDRTHCQLARSNGSSYEAALRYLSSLDSVTVKELSDRIDPDLVRNISQLYQRGNRGQLNLARLASIIGDQTVASLFARLEMDFQILVPSCDADGRFSAVQCKRFSNGSIYSCSCVNVLTGEHWGPTSRSASLDCSVKPGSCRNSSTVPCGEPSACTQDNECEGIKRCCVDSCGGRSCQFPSELACSSNPCFNGECVPIRADSYSCICYSGYIGANCETFRGTACYRNPNICFNGGTCNPIGYDKYNCLCSSGYYGRNCLYSNTSTPTPTPPPQPSVCQKAFCPNGTVCMVEEECLPIDEHLGECRKVPRCRYRSPIQSCDSSPCRNGGSCWYDGSRGLRCYCPTGFEGTMCERLKALPGVCPRYDSVQFLTRLKSSPNTVTFNCVADYSCGTGQKCCLSESGSNCVTSEHKGLSLCQQQNLTMFLVNETIRNLSHVVDVTLRDLAPLFTSDRLVQYARDIFQLDLGSLAGAIETLGDRSLGSLVNQSLPYIALPFPNCTARNFSAVQCLRFLNGSAQLCYCGNETTGERLGQQATYPPYRPVCRRPDVIGCASSPCLNGGSCIGRAGGNYYCSCPSSFYGFACQYYSGVSTTQAPLRLCESQSGYCQNGGTCWVMYDGNYRCYCPTGFEGAMCERLKALPGVCPRYDSVQFLTRLKSSPNTVTFNCVADYSCGTGQKCCLSEFGSNCVTSEHKGLSLCQQQNLTMFLVNETIRNLSHVVDVTLRDLAPLFTNDRLVQYARYIFQLDLGSLAGAIETLGDRSLGSLVNQSLPYIALPFPNCTARNFSAVQCLRFLNGSTQLCYCGNETTGERLGQQATYPPYRPVCRRPDKGTVCSRNPCFNGGSCIPIGFEDYQCICNAGYYGRNCLYSNTSTPTPTPPPQPSVCQNVFCPTGMVCMVEEERLLINNHLAELRKVPRCRYRSPIQSCDSSPCRNGGSCWYDGSRGPRCYCPTGFEGTMCERLKAFPGVCPRYDSVQFLTRLKSSPNTVTFNCVADYACGTGQKCCLSEFGSNCVTSEHKGLSLCQQQNLTMFLVNETIRNLSHVVDVTLRDLAPLFTSDRLVQYARDIFQLDLGSLAGAIETLGDRSLGSLVNQSLPYIALPFPNCTARNFSAVQCLRFLNGSTQLCYCGNETTGERLGQQATYPPYRPVCRRPDVIGCASSPCLNGGSCIGRAGGNYYCSCPSSFYGFACQYYSGVSTTQAPLRLCESQSGYCQNGGTCWVMYDGNYRCYCPTGFEGEMCERLKALPGVCPRYDSVQFLTRLKSSPDTVTFNCVADYACGTGQKCCLSEFGSNCVTSEHKGLSLCQQQNLTMFLVNETIRNLSHVVDVTLRDLAPLFTSDRLVQYARDIFQLDLGSLAGAIETLGDRSLGSLVNQSLPYIALPFPNCTARNFSAVQCLRFLNGSTQLCYCANETTGERLGQQVTYPPYHPVCRRPDVRGCASSPCLNGGSCQERAGGKYYCFCPSSFYGFACQYYSGVSTTQAPLRLCESQPGYCQNGGTCWVMHDGNYRCDCRCGYHGRNCEERAAGNPSPCRNYNCGFGRRCMVRQECRRPFGREEICRTVPVCEALPSCDSNPCLFGGSCFPDRVHGYQCYCPSGRIGMYCEAPKSVPGICPKVDAVKMLNNIIRSPDSFNISCLTDVNCTGVQKCCSTEQGNTCMTPQGRDLGVCGSRKATMDYLKEAMTNFTRVTNVTFGQLLRFALKPPVKALFSEMLQVDINSTTLGPYLNRSIGSLFQEVRPYLTLPFPTCITGGRFTAIQCMRYLNNTEQLCYCVNDTSGERISQHVSYAPWRPVCPRGGLCGQGMGQCYNGGTCRETTTGYSCLCNCGFYGPQCQYRDGDDTPVSTPAPHDPCQDFYCSLGQSCQIRKACSIGGGCQEEAYCTSDNQCPGPDCEERSCPLMNINQVTSTINDAFNSSVACNSTCDRNSRCSTGQKCCTVGCYSACVNPVSLNMTVCQRRNHSLSLKLKIFETLDSSHRSRSVSEFFTAARRMTIMDEIRQEIWPDLDEVRILRDYGNYPISLGLDFLRREFSATSAVCNSDGSFASHQCTVTIEERKGDCFCVDHYGDKRYGSSGIQSCRDITCLAAECAFNSRCQPIDDYGSYKCVEVEPPVDPCLNHTCGEGSYCSTHSDCSSGECKTVAECKDSCYPISCQNGATCAYDQARGLRCACRSGLAGLLCESLVLRSGKCPALNVTRLTADFYSTEWTLCEHECREDGDCPGNEKCCMDGCSGKCTAPLLADDPICKQQSAEKSDALAVINSLRNTEFAKVNVWDLFTATRNNSHLWTLFNRVMGTWSFDRLSYLLANTTFSELPEKIPAFRIAPFIDCDSKGLFKPRQCFGSLNKTYTFGCSCWTQSGFEVLNTKSIGSRLIDCEPDILTVKGQVTLNMSCGAGLSENGSTINKVFRSIFINEIRRIGVNSGNLVSVLGEIRVTNISCGSVEVDFEIDLERVEIVNNGLLIPNYVYERNIWQMDFDIFTAVYQSGVFNSSLPIIPASLRLFDVCASSPCYNGASCRQTGSGKFSCYCPEFYYGDRCQYYSGITTTSAPSRLCEFQPGRCLNGGTCRVAADGLYTCDCPCGFTGPLCEEKTQGFGLSPCRYKNCEPGSRCVVRQECRRISVVEEECKATPTCEVMPSCDSNPCLFGGSCVPDSFLGYQCLCPRGMMGRRCEASKSPGVCPKVDVVKMLNNYVSGSFKVGCLMDTNCTEGLKCCSLENGTACITPNRRDLGACEARKMEMMYLEETMSNLTRVNNITYGQLLRASVQVLRMLPQLPPINFTSQALSNLSIGSIFADFQPVAALPFPNCSSDGNFTPVQCASYLNHTTQLCYCVSVTSGERIDQQVSYSPWMPRCPTEDVCGQGMGECFNGGTCRQTTTGYRCLCNCGFYGPLCQYSGNTSTTTPPPRNPCEGYGCPLGEWCRTRTACEADKGCWEEPYCAADDPCDFPNCEERSCPLMKINQVTSTINDAFNSSVACNSTCDRNSRCSTGQKCCTVGCYSACVNPVSLNMSVCQRKNNSLSLVFKIFESLDSSHRGQTVSKFITVARRMTIMDATRQLIWPNLDEDLLLRDYGNRPISLGLDILRREFSMSSAVCKGDGSFASRQCLLNIEGKLGDCFCVNRYGDKIPCEDECPLRKCVPCESGYRRDEKNCSTCQCVDECENLRCAFGEECREDDLGKLICLPKPRVCETGVLCKLNGTSREICLETFLCDGDVECEGGEDEFNCTTTGPCDRGNRLCANEEKCVLDSLWCDGVFNCQDHSDEADCPTTTTPQTTTDECPLLKYVPCESGYRRDENNCSTCQCVDECENLRCAFGEECREDDLGKLTCLPKPRVCETGVLCKLNGTSREICLETFLCDGDVECEGGEDEFNCTTTGPCDRGNRLCANEEKCVLDSLWCDGVFNCQDHSDEAECPTTTTQQTTTTTTAAETLSGEIRINRDWSPDLNNASSELFKEIADNITAQLRRTLGRLIIRVNIISMEQGSVILVFEIVLAPDTVLIKNEGDEVPPGKIGITEAQVKATLKASQEAGELDQNIDIDTLVITVKCPALDCSPCESGHVVDSRNCSTCQCLNPCERVLPCDDGYECRQNTDGEFLCLSPCDPGNRLCANEEKCVLDSLWCDGVFNCQDHSDEADCPTTTTQQTTTPTRPTTTKTTPVTRQTSTTTPVTTRLTPTTTPVTRPTPTTTLVTTRPTTTKVTRPTPTTTPVTTRSTPTPSPTPSTTRPTTKTTPLTTPEISPTSRKTTPTQKTTTTIRITTPPGPISIQTTPRDRTSSGTKSTSPQTTLRKSTTTTAAAAAAVFSGQITLNLPWSDDLENPSSTSFREISDPLSTQILGALEGSGVIEVNIISMMEGSIIVNLELVFPPGTTTINVRETRELLRERQRAGLLPPYIDVDSLTFSVCPLLDSCVTRCLYGRELDAQGCHTCTCNQPCQSLNCASTQVCVVLPNNTAVCQTEKLGYCPSSQSIGGGCRHNCRFDASCPNSKKCCSGTCGTFCTDALDSPPRELSSCERELARVEQQLARTPLAPLSVPRCNLTTGAWKAVQCIDSWGVCHCVDAEGEVIPGSQTRGTPDCSAEFNASAVIPVCPNGETIYQCDPGLTLRSYCAENPTATCRINPCGQCVAEFFDDNNNVVSCNGNGLSSCMSFREARLESRLPSGLGSSVHAIRYRIKAHLRGEREFDLQLNQESTAVSGRYPVDFCGFEMSSSQAGRSVWFYNSDTRLCVQGRGTGNKINQFSSQADCQRQCVASGSSAPSFKGLFVPSCEAGSGFAFKQCHGRLCWCSDRAGAPVPGSLTTNDLNCGPDGVIGSDSDKAVCSDGSTPVICANSCADQTCGGHPEASCYADPCDDCRVVFTNKEGQILSCNDRSVCDLPADQGTCTLPDDRWFYNGEACELFTFNGCNGNENNFRTSGACKAACGEPTNSKCAEIEYRPLCENGQPSICHDECRGQTCSFFPEAVCRADICNDCQVQFYTADTDRLVDCTRLSTKCLRERAWKKSLATVPEYIPQCQEGDGEFSPKQCDLTECWCVNGEGEEIAGTRHSVEGRDSLLCAQNKTEKATFKFKIEADFTIVEGKEDEFKLKLMEALKLLLSSDITSNVDRIEITAGSIDVEVFFVDTQDVDLSEVIDMTTVGAMNGDLAVEFENVTYRPDPDSVFVTRTFERGPQSSTPIGPAPSTTPASPETTKVTEMSEQDKRIAIIIGSVCGAILLALIIGAIVVAYKKRRRQQKPDLSYSDSGEWLPSLPRPRWYSYVPYPFAFRSRSNIPVDNAFYFSNPTGLPADEYAQPERQAYKIYPSLTKSDK